MIGSRPSTVRGSVVLLLLAAGAVAGALSLSRLTFDHDTRSLLRSDPAADAIEEELVRRFGSEDLLLLAWPARTILDPEEFTRIEAVTRALAGVPGLENVYSLASPHVPFPLDGLRPLARADLETESGRARAEEALRRSPVYLGTLYNRDLDVASVAGTVAPVGRAAREAAVRGAREIAARFSRPGSGIVVAGVTALAMDANEYAVRDLRRIGAIALAAAAASLLLVCRSVKASIVALGATGVTPLVALGLASLLGVPFNAMGAALFPVLAVVGITSSIHLLQAYGEERESGRDASAAAWRASRRLAWPILLSLATTAAGFLSLEATGVPAFRDGGRIVSLGLLAAAPVLLLGIPAALAALAPRARGRSPKAARRLGRLALLAVRARRPILLGGALLAALGALFASRARVHVDVLQAFQPSSGVARTYRFLDERLTATLPVDLLVRPAEGEETAATLRRIEALEKRMLSIPGVESSLSMVTLVAQAAAYLGQTPPIEGAKLAVALAILRTAYAEQTRRFETTDEPRLYRLKLRVREGTGPEALDRILAEAEQASHGAKATGLYVRAARTARGLLRNLFLSIAAMAALVTLTASLAAGSLRAGLATLLPNLLPPLLLFGAAGLFRIPLDVSAVAVGAVAVGLTIDASLYLVFRAREERGSGPLRAIVRSQRSSGRAVLFSAAVLVAALSCLAFSTFLPTARFGFLTACACAIGLVGALVVLPAGLRALRAL